MKIKTLKKILQFILFLGIGILLVWISIKDFQSNDIQVIKDCLNNLLNPKSIFFLSLCFLFEIASHYVRGLRNILMIEPLGFKVTKRTSFFAVMICYLGNLAFPRLGEVLRCSFLKRCDNIPFEKSLGTIVTERIIDIVIWLLLFLVAALTNSTLISHFSIDEKGTTVKDALSDKFFAIATNYTLYVLFFAFLALVGTIYFTRKYWKKSSLFLKIYEFMKGIWQGLISVKNMKNKTLFILYSFGIWIFYFLSVYASFFAFDFLQHLGPMPALTILAFSTLSFVIAQGGLGAYPLMVAGVLILYNIDYNQGFTVGMVNWLVQTTTSIILGIVALVYVSQIEKNSKSKSYEE